MITLLDIVKLIVEGDKNTLGNLSTADKIQVTYNCPEQIVNEKTGETTVKITKKSKNLGFSGLKLGMQNINDNLDNNDPSTAANVTLANSLTIAWPIYSYIKKLENTVESLKERIEALENK